MGRTKRADPWAAAYAVTLLKDAHEALTHLMPAPDAPADAWRQFYLRSAEVYARVAEVDRGHHHEALYWAKRERAKAEGAVSDER
ncbi:MULTISPECIES: AMED_5909 family protein [Saccharothrix]|uniref:AMED_5909 family protein n=1 Tax=Saccharothrix TaxID=2071 RepID=UPI000B0F2DB5|nr:AMED_5909 family protein [Saccharothrix sp. CB00851]